MTAGATHALVAESTPARNKPGCNAKAKHWQGAHKRRTSNVPPSTITSAPAPWVASNAGRNTARATCLTGPPPAPPETPLSVACASSLWAALLKGAPTILPKLGKRWRRLSNKSDEAYFGRCPRRLCIGVDLLWPARLFASCACSAVLQLSAGFPEALPTTSNNSFLRETLFHPAHKCGNL